MGTNSTDGFCRLACATTAVAAGVGPVSVYYGPVYQGGQSAAPFYSGSRVNSSRAVRVTLDRRGVAPRMLRVYYSPDEDFANMALAVAVEAPSKLQSAMNATIGFSASGVSASCSPLGGGNVMLERHATIVSTVVFVLVRRDVHYFFAPCTCYCSAV